MKKQRYNGTQTIEEMFIITAKERNRKPFKIFTNKGYFTQKAECFYDLVAKNFFADISDFDKLCEEEHCWKD